MSIVPPGGGGSQARRPYRRPIRWHKLAPEQVDAVREYFPRNKWRIVVNTIIDNTYHYWYTHDTDAEYHYKQQIIDALGWTWERWEDLEEEMGDDGESLGWYHPPAGWTPGTP